MTEAFFEWMEEHEYAGPAVIAAIITAAVGLNLPYFIFAVGTGYTLKVAYQSTWQSLLIGTLCTFVGCFLGGILSFFSGRFLCRVKVKEYAQRNRVARAIETIMEKEGAKLIFLMRLSLIVPYNVSNLVFGAAAVSLKAYCVGTLGLIPMNLFYVYIGQTMSSIKEAVEGG